MSEKYVEFKLTDLPPNEFCVLLRPKIQKKLIEDAAKKFGSWGCYTKLAKHLHKTCKSFQNVKWKSLNGVYIPLWKRNKMFIPIDSVIELCRLSKRAPEEIKKYITSLKHKSAPNKTAILFNFRYDESFAIVSEAIKVEGHIKKNKLQCSTSSESVKFINYFKTALKSFKISEKSVYENLVVEMDVPTLNVIKVLNDGRELNFKVYKKGKKIKLRFNDHFVYSERRIYNICTISSDIKLGVKIPINSKIKTVSSYGHSGATIHLTITNTTFIRILHLLGGVPLGRKSDIIKLCPLVHSSPVKVKKVVLSTVMSCEGWVEVKSRRIRFFVKSRDYINEIKKVLERFGIKPSINGRNYLSITSKGDLTIFAKNFNFIIKEKKHKLGQILKTYERIVFRHEEGLIRTLKLLKENKTLTAYELAQKLKKHKDTAFSHLNKGVKRRLIFRDTKRMPYKYSITHKGEFFLDNELNISSWEVNRTG